MIKLLFIILHLAICVFAFVDSEEDELDYHHYLAPYNVEGNHIQQHHILLSFLEKLENELQQDDNDNDNDRDDNEDSNDRNERPYHSYLEELNKEGGDDDDEEDHHYRSYLEKIDQDDPLYWKRKDLWNKEDDDKKDEDDNNYNYYHNYYKALKADERKPATVDNEPGEEDLDTGMMNMTSTGAEEGNGNAYDNHRKKKVSGKRKKPIFKKKDKNGNEEMEEEEEDEDEDDEDEDEGGEEEDVDDDEAVEREDVTTPVPPLPTILIQTLPMTVTNVSTQNVHSKLKKKKAPKQAIDPTIEGSWKMENSNPEFNKNKKKQHMDDSFQKYKKSKDRKELHRYDDWEEYRKGYEQGYKDGLIPNRKTRIIDEYTTTSCVDCTSTTFVTDPVTFTTTTIPIETKIISIPFSFITIVLPNDILTLTIPIITQVLNIPIDTVLTTRRLISV